MADEFEQAQALEEADRTIALQQHASRHRPPARDDCADCGVDLQTHRRQYGTCVDCQTIREAHARHRRKD